MPALASAQNADHQYRGQGYVFVGEGAALELSPALYGVTHIGGGEVLLVRGFGVGGELGAMGTPSHGVGVLSIDPS